MVPTHYFIVQVSSRLHYQLLFGTILCHGEHMDKGHQLLVNDKANIVDSYCILIHFLIQKIKIIYKYQ